MISAEAEYLVTADQAIRGGKLYDLYGAAKKAVRECPTIKTVFVDQRSCADIPYGPKDVLMKPVSYHRDLNMWYFPSKFIHSVCSVSIDNLKH